MLQTNEADEETRLIQSNDIDEFEVKRRGKLSTMRKIVILAGVVTLFLVFLAISETILERINARHLSNGKKIYLTTQIPQTNGKAAVFMKLHHPRNEIVYGESYSRYQSGAFEFYPEKEDNDKYLVDGTCFRIRSMNGKWLTIDYDNKVKAIASSYYFGYSFSIYHADDSSQQVKLKLCDKNRWLYMSFDSHNRMYFLEASTSPHHDIQAQLEIENQATNFEIKEVDFYKGVNLGGWFIPEVWMLSSFFNGTGLGWGGSLCSMMNYSVSLTEKRMEEHLKSWITEEDFRLIHKYGFNSVRLPIGYWNIIEDPYLRYAPLDLSISLSYIDWSFNMAKKYNLSIVLDLHGGPGSQNGQDHSGCGYSIIMPEWTKKKNIHLSLKAIDTLAKRYANHPNLLGIELLNEPSELITQKNHTALRLYYENGYHIIRKYSNKTFVIFSELYDYMFPIWDKIMDEPNYFNVIIDLHLYDWMGNHNEESKTKHIQDAQNWKQIIQRVSSYHPVMVGEWCMSTGTKIQVGQSFVTTAVNSFTDSFGWYMWNWKIEHQLGFYEWDVKYQLERDLLSPFKKV